MFLSTKMVALNEHLSQLSIEDKVVIFSQFLGMLDLLEMELKKQKIKYVVIYLLFREWKGAIPISKGPG